MTYRTYTKPRKKWVWVLPGVFTIFPILAIVDGSVTGIVVTLALLAGVIFPVLAYWLAKRLSYQFDSNLIKAFRGKQLLYVIPAWSILQIDHNRRTLRIVTTRRTFLITIPADIANELIPRYPVRTYSPDLPDPILYPSPMVFSIPSLIFGALTPVCYFVIFIAAIISALAPITGYSGRHPDLYTQVIHSFPYADGYVDDDNLALAGILAGHLEVVESDAFGRRLVVYHDPDWKMLLVSQYSTNQEVYYYPDCYLYAPALANYSDFQYYFSNSEVLTLLNASDWDSPLVFKNMIARPIVTDIIKNEEAASIVRDAVRQWWKGQSDSTPTLTHRLVDVDSTGRMLFHVEASTSDIYHAFLAVTDPLGQVPHQGLARIVDPFDVLSLQVSLKAGVGWQG